MTMQKSGYLADEWVEFDNGCLCCTAKDAAMLAIEALLRKRTDIDHIVIETSGMADPGPLIQRLWADDALECRAQLDGIICLVDAMYGLARLDSASPTYCAVAAKQIALADLIILNKMDLIERRQAVPIEEIFSRINPMAIVEESRYSVVPLKEVLNLGEYSAAKEKKLPDLSGLIAGLGTSSHVHAKGLRSFSILSPPFRGVSLDHFERWLFTLLWEHRVSLDGVDHELGETEIMRVKGILLDLPGYPYALQAVQEMYDLVPLNACEPDAGSRIVFIGRISAEHEGLIKASFLRLFSDPLVQG